MMTEESTKAMEEVKIGDSAPGEQEDVVDPWNVKSSSDKGVDYDKLISKIFMFITVFTHTHTHTHTQTQQQQWQKIAQLLAFVKLYFGLITLNKLHVCVW